MKLCFRFQKAYNVCLVRLSTIHTVIPLYRQSHSTTSKVSLAHIVFLKIWRHNATLFVFIASFIPSFMHSSMNHMCSIHSLRCSLDSSLLGLSRETFTAWGAEPGFETGTATQQPDAITNELFHSHTLPMSYAAPHIVHICFPLQTELSFFSYQHRVRGRFQRTLQDRRTEGLCTFQVRKIVTYAHC
jgi:hypothetical protein